MKMQLNSFKKKVIILVAAAVVLTVIFTVTSQLQLASKRPKIAIIASRKTIIASRKMSGTATLTLTVPRCTAADLKVSLTTPSSDSQLAGKVLWASGMHNQLILFNVYNIADSACSLRGYMIPVWTNVSSGNREPYPTQGAMAAHRLEIGNPGDRKPLGILATVTLSPGEAAGFVVSTSGRIPAGAITPGGTHLVAMPDKRSTTHLPSFYAESPLLASNSAVRDYCQYLNGQPTCITLNSSTFPSP